ncbi:MAG: hypothetical protein KN64_14355 [Sulfurovum sp. AS07-7]|nr:MAG: hypothetical protein KN64_14355 [Sulfurovum sp. AS07-7]
MSENLAYKSKIEIQIFIVSLCEICLKILSIAKKLTYSKCPSETQKHKNVNIFTRLHQKVFSDEGACFLQVTKEEKALWRDMV